MMVGKSPFLEKSAPLATPKGPAQKRLGEQKGRSSFLAPSAFRNLHSADATRARGPRCWGEDGSGEFPEERPSLGAGRAGSRTAGRSGATPPAPVRPSRVAPSPARPARRRAPAECLVTVRLRRPPRALLLPRARPRAAPPQRALPRAWPCRPGL